ASMVLAGIITKTGRTVSNGFTKSEVCRVSKECLEELKGKKDERPNSEAGSST
ncbi:unnamed protein product, partial [marine sediment metagenome]